jgi:hypothetical protein
MFKVFVKKSRMREVIVWVSEIDSLMREPSFFI